MSDAPKRVLWNKNLDEVYPAIIVHLRQMKTNILAIELKKTSKPERKEKDIQKLQAYRCELGYGHALFIRFGVEEYAGTISECQ